MKVKILSKDEFKDALDPKLPNKYISPSQLGLYLNCPRSYYHRYVEGNRSKANEKMIIGSATHKLIENCIKLKIADNNITPPIEKVLDDSRSVAEELYFDEEGEAPLEAELGFEGAIDSTQKSFITWYKNRMPLISPVCAEKEMLCTINGIPVKGFIDYIDATPEGLKVVDIKVGKKKRNPKDSLQLGMYALAEGTPLVGFDTILQPTKRLPHRLEITEVTLPQAYLNHVESILTNVYRGITQGFFPQCLPDHWLCTEKWCPNFSQCRGKA